AIGDNLSPLRASWLPGDHALRRMDLGALRLGRANMGHDRKLGNHEPAVRLINTAMHSRQMIRGKTLCDLCTRKYLVFELMLPRRSQRALKQLPVFGTSVD